MSGKESRLMYRQNTASQKYAAWRIGPRHIQRNLEDHSPIKGEGKDVAIHVDFKSIGTPRKVRLMFENGTMGDDNA